MTQVQIDVQELLGMLREQLAGELVRLHTDLAIARLEAKKLREMLEAVNANGGVVPHGAD